MDTNPSPKNLAETLAEVLPDAKLIHSLDADGAVMPKGLHLAHVSVPKSSELKKIEIDLEKHLPNPRRTTAVADFATAQSFLDYIARHAKPETAVWCNFNPQTFALDFTAVVDEHAKDAAGWRAHRATYKPELAAEWKAWKGAHKTAMPQVAFAEWIQEHEDDITSANGLPTSLQMLEMATNFVMNEERQFKSAVRLQSGGMRLTYIADPDQGTVEQMSMFDKFAIGIPVFHGGQAWSITARLKYRNAGGKLSFHYELIRPDRVHNAAANELITQVRDGLVAGVPLLMGQCN